MSEPVRICIVTGPPVCGKSKYALEKYQVCVEEYGHDAALYLVPTQRVADLVRGRLAASGPQGLFDFRVMTFADVANMVLVANHANVSAISASQRLALLHTILAELDDAQLGPLAAHRARPSLSAVLAQDIDELKAAGLAPGQFVRAVESLPGSDLARALAVVYSRYQALLTDLELYDEPGKLWEAQAQLEQGCTKPFAGRLRLVIADGFSDFTTTQLRVLTALVGLAGMGLITLTYDPRDDRPELQDLPARALATLRSHLTAAGGVVDERPLPCDAEPRTDLEYLRRYLFVPDVPESSARDGSVVFMHAPGPWAEVRLVAREIKRLLHQGRLSGKACPQDVAIIVRNLDPYQQALREVFAEYEISLFVSRGEPVARRPSVRLVLDLLSLVVRDFPRSLTIALWDSGYVQLSRLVGDEEVPATAAEADNISRRAGIAGGREAWLSSFDRLETRLEHTLARRQAAAEKASEEYDDESFETIEELSHALEVVSRVRATFDALASLLDPLSRSADTATLVEVLFGVLEVLGVDDAIARRGAKEQTAADLRAWNAFIEALHGLADADRLAGGQVVSPTDFLAQLAETAEALRIHSEGRGEGRVVALDVHDALQTAFDYVFLLGLTEGCFPQRGRLDPLIPDDQRREIAQRGIGLRPRLEAHDEEAYLFHLALSVARRRLYLCYPDTDAAGEPLLRSFYLDEAERLLPGRGEKELRLRDVVPPLSEAAGLRELLERFLHVSYEDREAPDASYAAEARKALMKSSAGTDGAPWAALALADLGARVERLRDGRLADLSTGGSGPATVGPYDGVLLDPAVGAILADRFGPRHLFSAGQLSGYATCPMDFFFERVLNLEELMEPGDDVTALEVGQLTHRVLAEFYRRRPERDGGRRHVALDADDEQARAEALALLQATATEVFDDFQRRGLTANETVWRITRRLLMRRLENWLAVEAEVPAKLKLDPVLLVPKFFEQLYGLQGTPPLVLQFDETEPVAVCGRIDRLDEVGDDCFVVYDYKGKSAPSTSDIRRGEDYQLVLYALASERLLYAGARRCVAWTYVRVGYPVDRSLSANVSGLKDLYELVEESIKLLGGHIVNLRAGWFAWGRRCVAEYCAFAPICRYDPQRRLRRGLYAAREEKGNE